ncbi:porphobilinogen synthase [Geobacillus sp. MMMUD3]|nr:porphobilinogen synthase [Geobacillus sp. MMMUD3]TWG31406.1 delta-aminolevulinic acid dehydratase/porphobilinogen synthase [Geobacillus sp. C56-T2]
MGALVGKTVLVTRAKDQAAPFSAKLREAGAIPVEIPLIAIREAARPDALAALATRLGDYDWLVFTSANAVRCFFSYVSPLQPLPNVAAVGRKTAAALAEYGVAPALVPDDFTAERLAVLLAGRLRPGARVLFVKGDLARPVLPAMLREAGAIVEELTVYETVLDASGRERLLSLLRARKVDVVTLMSPSAVTSLVRLLGREAALLLSGTAVACIGPVTKDAAERQGIAVQICPTDYTADGIIRAMEQYFSMEGTRMTLPFDRHRRLRQTAAIRAMVRETHLHVDDFIYPLFVVEGSGIRREVSSMPGVYHLSLDRLPEEIDDIAKLGIRAVMVFGVPNEKDEVGSQAYCETGIVQRAIRQIKAQHPEMVVIADTCLCEYTSHGHCGVVENDQVLNDPSLELLAKTAVSQAQAGADIIAPSNMMDGFVAAIRRGLDEAGFVNVPIMSYAIKYASAFYGPFREAADSAPQFGDRKTYQMDPANRLEAFREAESDVKEGADFLMVKPALAYMDIIRDIKNRFPLPLVAYNVSGEYSMIKAAAQNGWIDEKAVVMEMLTGMKRAGADLIITYFAKDVARWLAE